MASNFLDQWKQSGRKINHTGFDLSGKRCFTLPAGLMTMPFFMATNPNEHFELDVQGLLRTETLNTAAYSHGRIITSMFFVPYSQLWHNFNSFVTQKDDRHSSAQREMANLPSMSLKELYRFYASFYLSYLFLKKKYRMEPTQENCPNIGSSDKNSYESLMGADNHFNFCFTWDIQGIPYVHNLGRAIQFFRFGTPYLISEFIDTVISENYVPSSDTDDDWNSYKTALSLANSKTYTQFFQDNDWLAGKFVNLLRPAAYQHVFYDYYRNKYFDEEPFYQPSSGVTRVRYIDTFNFDDIECSSLGTSVVIHYLGISVTPQNFETARFLNLFDMHYRQYKHDIFTSAMNSTQFGAVSSVSFDGSGSFSAGVGSDKVLYTDANGNIKAASTYQTSFISSLESQSLDYTTPNGDYTDGTAAVYGTNISADTQSVIIGGSSAPVRGISNADISVPFFKFHIPSLFDVLQLRRAELLQQWKMNALRAGNMVDDNFRQHYGVEPFYESDNNVRLIGSWECVLETNAVTATATTGEEINGNVGDLAAIGIGNVKGSKVRFKCNDFGTIIAISYFLPDVFYSANGIDEENTLMEPFDFYSEEFENVGFEPLPYYNQSIGNHLANDSNIGFVPPYTRYKTNTDVVFGEFSQVANINSNSSDYDGLKFEGTLRSWTMQRDDIPMYDVNGQLVRSKKAFYVDPRVTNPLFAVYYDGRQTTDPMHCFYNFDVKALRPMSVLGLPIFG